MILPNEISEIQIESGGRRVNAYTHRSFSGITLLNKIGHATPWSLYGISSIAFHKADGINYLQNSYPIIMKGKPPVKIAKDLKIIDPADYFAYIIYEDGTLNYKLYDMELENYELPALPKGCRIQRHSGIGVNSAHSIRDVYFTHKSRTEVLDFYSHLVGDQPFLDQEFPEEGFFAISYDSLTCEPKMLKRYIFND